MRSSHARGGVLAETAGDRGSTATAQSAEEWGTVAIELGLPPDAGAAAIADAYQRPAVTARLPCPAGQRRRPRGKDPGIQGRA